MRKQAQVTLYEQCSIKGPQRKVEVTINTTAEGSLCIEPKGYGDATSTPNNGIPIMLEIWEGKLRLVVWGNIMKDEPTHIIDMEGAREDRAERIEALKGVGA